jgi:DNA gyrase subunit A
MKTSSKIGKGTSINLIENTTQMMVISQFSEIIRIDAKPVLSAGRSTSGPASSTSTPMTK